jgi:hypothetical protein
VKKLKYLSLAFLVASSLAIPATAQRHPMGRMGQMSHRNNSPDLTKGSKAEKTRTREGWEKNAKHKAKGHSK